VLDEAGKNPVWDETLMIEMDSPDDFLKITCMNEDVFSDDFVGETNLPAIKLCGGDLGQPKNAWYDLFYKGKKAAELQLEGRIVATNV
jgi:Ca2+-dependent lipid-binding protein